MPSSPDELLTHVTDDDEIIGPVERHRVHGNPEFVHRTAHVFVLHPREGTLLLQKRAAGKDTHPGKWDVSVGGHVGFGQSYLEAAMRETREELGLDVSPAALEFLHHFRYRDPRESENVATWICLHPGPFLPEAAEIEALRFWSRTEIRNAVGTGVFTPHFEAEFPVFLAGPRGALLRA